MNSVTAENTILVNGIRSSVAYEKVVCGELFFI